MTDNELLLAISDIMEKKIKAEIKPLKVEMQAIKEDITAIQNEQKRINVIIENEIQSDVKILAENYMPAAKRYEKATAKIEAILTDVEILKSVVKEHSEKLQKIS